MFCERCGRELEDDAAFCESCGHGDAGTEAEEPAEEIVAASAPDAEPVDGMAAGDEAEASPVDDTEPEADAAPDTMPGDMAKDSSAPEPPVEKPSPVDGDAPGDAPADDAPSPAASPASSSPAASPASPSSSPSPSRPPRKRGRVALLVALGVAGVALAAVAGAWAGSASRQAPVPSADGGQVVSVAEGEGEPGKGDHPVDEPASGGSEASGPAAATEGGDGGESGSKEGSQPAAPAEPAPEPAPEPEASAPAVPDLSDPDDRYALNKFMSNFSESLMYQASQNQMFSDEKRYASAHFDRDNPNYGIMADFLCANNWQNDGTKINGGEEDGYATFVPWSSVNYMTNLFFDREYDWGDYVRGSQYGVPNGKEDVGLAFYITNGVPSGGPTVVQSVESLGNGLIRIGYDAYIEDSSNYNAYGNYSGLGSPELYGMDIPEINSFLGTSGPTAHGSAVLEAHRDGDGWRFALVSYDLDEPASM